ncbi:isocitrate dehydrogenase kinase/phosphatase [Steroidobacter denitrificans]|uniref:Isocitrate dehydrogenase kinase/phosphatase n=1 Tax=Steroidobacter denitrificans TaxID=465721 RepID=A0A127F941_STEDE|nr:bifunctional isocitrate dehydrogenase kinase/phosphatase [Steroidobacter denitrificans]AMN46079.1 isocitrate dehydrogenase kinase/phosphatase [Steroidobacter denitrificans]
MSSIIESSSLPLPPGNSPRDLLVEQCASALARAFADYNTEYRAITRRAPHRFEERDWRGSQRDAVERIELYEKCVNRAVAQMRNRLGEDVNERAVWSSIKRRFTMLIETLPDREFDKTFFNSVTRRTFGTVGVDAAVEFVALDFDPIAAITAQIQTSVYVNRGSLELLFEDVLTEYRFRTPYVDFERSIQIITNEVRAQLERDATASQPPLQVTQIEFIRTVFFQMTRAYVVGRISGPGWMRPFVLALKNSDSGIVIDAVMMDEDTVSILFSFTRSYFHADLTHVGQAVVFLKSILPLKAVSELYTVLGRAKQGKTERYRELFRHLQQSEDQFIHAPGERGLVMICFTLPSYDVVFKIIRDRFAYPKNVLREEVLQKYELVFKHDRAGRLVDAQEFKRLKFPVARFSAAVLEELNNEAANTVHFEGDELVIGHMYIERRMTPLNLYLRDASPRDAELAVLDYGQCIRDLAVTNIFAGDLLLKNFGVTRHGRVIFYDYDELCAVSDCRFREVPQARHEEDEMRAEAWFHVNENDVFPETFINFLGFDERLKTVFLEVHGEVMTAQWWREIQQRLQEGDVLEVLPYHRHRVHVFGSF